MRPYPIGTMAAYYWYGIEYNVFPIDLAQHWAGVIGRSNQASAEIAQVARANGRAEVLQALRNAITADTDLADIGRSLFGYISDELGAGKIGIREALRAASQIAASTGQSKEVSDTLERVQDAYFRFVEDSIRVLSVLSKG